MAPVVDYEDWATKYLDIRSLSFREANVVCPFHADHAPSLRFNLDSGLWLCHGCHESGNAYSMARRLSVEGPDEQDVSIDVLERKITEMIEATESASEDSHLRKESWLNQFLTDEQSIMDYWSANRRISKEVISKFRLGYDVRNSAATIPIEHLSSDGWYYGVVRRFLDPDSQPHKMRYLNPSGFRKAEYVLFLGHVHGSTVAVAEGPIDALKLWSAGIPSVSVFGSSMSQQQARLIKKWGITTIVSFFDNDPAGRVGTMKTDQVIYGTGLSHYTVDWGGSRWKDPGELGNRELRTLYRDAIPFFKWGME